MDKRQNQQQPEMMTRAQAAQMIRLQRHANKQRGCLLSIVWLLLFNIFYVAWLAIKLGWRLIMWPVRVASRVGWDVIVKWPIQATVAFSRATWRAVQAATPWAARGGQAFHARYGAKGWAVVAGAVVVLAILGSIIH